MHMPPECEPVCGKATPANSEAVHKLRDNSQDFGKMHVCGKVTSANSEAIHKLRGNSQDFGNVR